MSARLYFVKGADPVLRDQVLDAVIDEVLGDEDRAFALEEFTVPGGTRARRGSVSGDSAGDESGSDDSDRAAASVADDRDSVVGAFLTAASSPPFMTASRVAVARDCGNLVKADIDAIARYLDDPLDTTVLVFVAGGGATTALEKVLKAADVVVRAPKHEATKDVLLDAAHDAGVLLTHDAASRIESHLAGDAGRAVGLVDILANARDTGTRLDVDDVTPYLGEEGAVPMYALTNAIENGDAPGALEVLHRLLTVTNAQLARPMHPLQLMGSLLAYYRRVMRLDDPAVRSSADAVEALGGKIKEYPARKALAAARALGTDGIREAFDALARADLDLKGARGMPEDAVMEVLVVRLARLSARSGVSAGSRSGGSTGRGSAGRSSSSGRSRR